MKIKVIDGIDLAQSVKIAIIAENISLGLYKKKFKNLVDNFSNRLDIAYIGAFGFGRQAVVGVEFQSPVHDGWLNEYKPVADLFFSGYKFGGKYWDDKVEDIYPHLSLYMRSAAEKERFSDYISSYSIEVHEPFTSPFDAENSVIPADTYYEKVEIYEDVEEIDPISGKSTIIKKHTKDIYTFFAMPLDKLFTMPNRFFYDFIAADRIRMDVDVAKSSWLSSFIPIIVAAVSVVFAVATYGASSAISGFGTTLAAEGASVLSAAELTVFGTNTFAAAVFDTFGSVGLELVGAASYASSAYNLYDSFSTLSSLSSAPSGFSMSVGFSPITNSISYGSSPDDFFALPKIDLPIY